MESKLEIINKIKDIKEKMKTMNNLERLLTESYELVPLYVALGKLISEE